MKMLYDYNTCSKISNNFLFLFSIQMVFRAGSHKMLAREPNMVDSDQTASEEVWSGSEVWTGSAMFALICLNIEGEYGII